jgi:hypothetical protein
MISMKKLAEELGKPLEQIEAVREAKLSSTQWSRRGRGISLTDEGEKTIRGHFVIPEAFPPKKKAFVKRPANNPRFVWCVIEGLEGTFPVAIPRRFHGKLVGKYITVDAISDNSGTTYRHEALGL